MQSRATTEPEVIGPTYPELLAKLTGAALSSEYAAPLADELIYDAYASPFLQAMLNAVAEDRCYCRGSPSIIACKTKV